MLCPLFYQTPECLCCCSWLCSPSCVRCAMLQLSLLVHRSATLGPAGCSPTQAGRARRALVWCHQLRVGVVCLCGAMCRALCAVCCAPCAVHRVACAPLDQSGWRVLQCQAHRAAPGLVNCGAPPRRVPPAFHPRPCTIPCTTCGISGYAVAASICTERWLWGAGGPGCGVWSGSTAASGADEGPPECRSRIQPRCDPWWAGSA